MFEIDVGNDRIFWREFQERSVAFIRFRDEIFPLTQTGLVACGATGDHAADGGRRLQPRLDEHVGDHRSGGRLAVGAGDGDRGLPLHQLDEKLGPLQDGDFLLARLLKFGIILRDRRGEDHEVRAADIFSRVTDRDTRALLP